MARGQRERIAAEMAQLRDDGSKLLRDAAEALTTDKPIAAAIRSGYQQWLSKTMPVVKQLMPDRYEEFCSIYQLPRRTKLDLSTYRLVDFFNGIRPTGYGADTFANLAVEMLMRQFDILQAAEARLDSALADIRGTLQAEIFDHELDAARDLSKRGHLRAAGALAGVVLERHLQGTAAVHGLPIRKRNPTIADLNDPLKEAGIYDLPVWRNIQYLADIRNLCSHQKDRDPSKDEVTALIDGCERVTKTIF